MIEVKGEGNLEKVVGPGRALVAPTVFGNFLRVKEVEEPNGDGYGVGFEFLNADMRTIRDFETIERFEALTLALYLAGLATARLTPDETILLYTQVTQEFVRMDLEREGVWTPRIIEFPFSPSAAADPPSSSAVEGPGGGAFEAAPPPLDSEGVL